MASGNVVLPCAARPLDVGNGQTVEVTYSAIVDREACLYDVPDDEQHRRAWERMTIRPVKTGMKWCSDCGDWRPLSYFGNDSRRSDGKRVYCRQCESARDRRRHQAKKAG